MAAAVAAFALIAAGFGWRVHAYNGAFARATAIAYGTVIEDRIGDSGDIRVRWVDRGGYEHVQRFAIYDTDQYAKGRVFQVAYDPSGRRPTGFPADVDETSAEDDLYATIAIAGVVMGVLVLAWALRGLLFRRAASGPGHMMTASALSGRHTAGGVLSPGESIWFALAETATPQTPVCWQRVMWHPAADTVRDGVLVVVHGAPARRRRVTVELSGGTRLVPIGRLRHRPPKRMLLRDRADSRVNLEDAFVLPAETPMPAAQPWWRRSLVFAILGTALGAVLGFLIVGGVEWVLSFAAGGSAVLVNAWALTGAEP
jgi:hypothetical protein